VRSLIPGGAARDRRPIAAAARPLCPKPSGTRARPNSARPRLCAQRAAYRALRGHHDPAQLADLALQPPHLPAALERERLRGADLLLQHLDDRLLQAQRILSLITVSPAAADTTAAAAEILLQNGAAGRQQGLLRAEGRGACERAAAAAGRGGEGLAVQRAPQLQLGGLQLAARLRQLSAQPRLLLRVLTLSRLGLLGLLQLLLLLLLLLLRQRRRLRRRAT
jgi:hypothetical protein